MKLNWSFKYETKTKRVELLSHSFKWFVQKANSFTETFINFICPKHGFIQKQNTDAFCWRCKTVLPCFIWNVSVEKIKQNQRISCLKCTSKCQLIFYWNILLNQHDIHNSADNQEKQHWYKYKTKLMGGNDPVYPFGCIQAAFYKIGYIMQWRRVFVCFLQREWMNEWMVKCTCALASPAWRGSEPHRTGSPCLSAAPLYCGLFSSLGSAPCPVRSGASAVCPALRRWPESWLQHAPWCQPSPTQTQPPCWPGPAPAWTPWPSAQKLSSAGL